MKKIRFLLVIPMLLLIQGYVHADVLKKANFRTTESVSLGGAQLESIVIQKPALYPEGIEYNPKTDKFIVGSFREGAVYEIDLDGSYRKIINDDRLNSVLAVRIDVKRNKLFVVNSDIGASIRSSSSLQ
jgi:hypothetical protein